MGRRVPSLAVQADARHTRYQGAILRDGRVPLVRMRITWPGHPAHGREFWCLPGGGIEAGEAPEACVAREMLEETGLEVRVGPLLLDLPGLGGTYRRERTYHCGAAAGEAAPGCEPEAGDRYAITAVRWVALGDERDWGDEILGDRITLRNLRALRRAIGAPSGGG